MAVMLVVLSVMGADTQIVIEHPNMSEEALEKSSSGGGWVEFYFDYYCRQKNYRPAGLCFRNKYQKITARRMPAGK